MGMNARQKHFVQEYLKDKNATRSAKAAGYSKKTAEKIGSENIRKPEIAKAIEAGLAKQLAKAELTGDMIIAELRRLAFVNITKAYGQNGTLLHPHQMPEDLQLALQSVEVEELFANQFKIGDLKKIKLHDKVRSLELLGKHFQLFTDVVKSEVNATVAMVSPEQVKAARDKLNSEV